ncbi:MAG: hypothetical protein GY810_25745 [Aureispira sp.]|nr:hypothetical protein [Aureispira sp.]
MKEDFRNTFKQYQKKVKAANIQMTEHLDYLQKGYINNNMLLSLFQKLIAVLRTNRMKIIHLTKIMQEYYAQ